MSKLCNNCNIEKSFDNFNTKPSRNGKRRYNYICKQCQSVKNKERNRLIRESKKKSPSQKKCNKCLIEKSSEEFTLDNYQKSGLSKMCKSCQYEYYENNKERIQNSNKKSQVKHKDKCNARKKAWASDNKEKVRKASKDYYENNREKALAATRKWAKENPISCRSKGHKYRAAKRDNTIHKFSKEQLLQRMSIFNFRCAYCNGPFEHIDHVKPISKGGPHCLSNLRPSCQKCNQSKFNKNLSDWLDEK